MLKTVAVITKKKTKQGDRHLSLTAIDRETGESESFREYGTNETVEQVRSYLSGLYPGCDIVDKTDEQCSPND